MPDPFVLCNGDGAFALGDQGGGYYYLFKFQRSPHTLERCLRCWLAQRCFRAILSYLVGLYSEACMRVVAIAIGYALFIVGCAAVYEAPPVESRAHLRLSPAIQVFQYFDNGEDCSDPRRFDNSNNPLRRQDRTLPIPSGRRIGMNLVSVGSDLSSCSIVLTLIPQAGRLYEAQMEQRGNKCFANIVESDRHPSVTAKKTLLKQVLQGFGACSDKNK